jgi:CheY-like chemotaxis protein
MQSLPIILVVEDDQLIQSIVEEALEEGGFEIDLSSSAKQAIEKLDNAGGKYRALVTDINLVPDKTDGWEIARHAREIDPEFPVVYMSGDSADAWASKGVPNSIMLSKPSPPPNWSPRFPNCSTTGHTRVKAPEDGMHRRMATRFTVLCQEADIALNCRLFERFTMADRDEAPLFGPPARRSIPSCDRQ